MKMGIQKIDKHNLALLNKFYYKLDPRIRGDDKKIFIQKNNSVI